MLSLKTMVVLKQVLKMNNTQMQVLKLQIHAADIFNDAEIIVKVKEPQKVEVDMIRENQIVYTYLHLAAAKELTEGLIKSKSINIAYETVTDDNGRLPLLAPMSAVAGRMSIQAGAHCLRKKSKRKRSFIRWRTWSYRWNSSYFRWWCCWRKCSCDCNWYASKSAYCR